MAVSRHQVVRENFLRALETLEVAPSTPDPVAESSLPEALARQILESQLESRLIDLEARAMKARNDGFYTIGSSGHEGNACVAAALRPSDPCFLHYRSGAFMMQRARQVPGETPIFDTLLSLAASSEDPISGGRHKVWGSRSLNVPPQTSTIASHLPKALGAAFALERGRKLKHDGGVPSDAIVMASFGDASLNHSTAVGAINAALWARHQTLPLPLLLVCEDNGIGISVRTPGGWIESQYANRKGLAYFAADGLDLEDAWFGARRAVEYCRRKRVPTMLHLKTIRLMGHAGSDVEQTYRSLAEIEDVERCDPLIKTAAWMVRRGVMSGQEIRALHDEIEERVQAASREASSRPKLRGRDAILSALAPTSPARVHDEAARATDPERRLAAHGGARALPELSRPRHMAMLINWALHDLMAKYPEMLLFGEDVARKGGVYNLTSRIYERFGVGRVFNTLLDEQSILGLAIGAGHFGFLPCPEIQYLAYLVHASDQLRGEACSLQFFSDRRFQNPMVLRVASLAYQKGFGGHFHNDNGFAFLREIPGLLIACPSRGDDAVGMLRTAFAAAKIDGRVVCFMEPIALYMTKDLYADGDEGWSFPYPPPGAFVPLGEPRVYEPPTPTPDLVVVTYGNGVPMSLRAMRPLADEGVYARVVDLRWLAPLDETRLLEAVGEVRRVLIVDEGRRTGGIGEQIAAILAERGHPDLRLRRVAGADSYVPLAAAADEVLVSEADVRAGARALLGDAIDAEPRGDHA